jgi:hypothetical protein
MFPRARHPTKPSPAKPMSIVAQGLKFKAKYVAEHDPAAPDEEVMESIVVDLLEMEG